MAIPAVDDFPAPPERGVYLVRFRTAHGERVVAAVDSSGRTIRKVVVRGMVTRAAAERLCWATLNEKDPVPQLRLVSEAAAPEPPSPAVSLALWGRLSAINGRSPSLGPPPGPCPF